MSRWLHSVLLATGLCLTTPHVLADTPPSDPIRTLIVKSGLHQQLQQVNILFRNSMLQNSSFLPPPILQQLANKAEIAFASGYLEQETHDYLTDHLSVDEQTALLSWLDSDLGQRINQEEVKGGSRLFADTTGDGNTTPKLSPARKKLLQQLIVSTNTVDMLTDIQIQLMQSLFQGIASMSETHGKVVDSSPLLAHIEQQRPQFQAAIQERSLHDFAIIYHGLSDQELNQYLLFSRSPLGQHYNQVLADAMQSSLSEASVSFGELLTTL